MVHDSTIAVEQGDGRAPPCVEVEGPRFRVRTSRVSTQWLPDTPSNRHLTVVWFRLLVDEHGKALVHVTGVSRGRGQSQPASGEPASRRFSAGWRGFSCLCAAQAQGRCGGCGRD